MATFTADIAGFTDMTAEFVGGTTETAPITEPDSPTGVVLRVSQSEGVQAIRWAPASFQGPFETLALVRFTNIPAAIPFAYYLGPGLLAPEADDNFFLWPYYRYHFSGTIESWSELAASDASVWQDWPYDQPIKPLLGEPSEFFFVRTRATPNPGASTLTHEVRWWGFGEAEPSSWLSTAVHEDLSFLEGLTLGRVAFSAPSNTGAFAMEVAYSSLGTEGDAAPMPELSGGGDGGVVRGDPLVHLAIGATPPGATPGQLLGIGAEGELGLVGPGWVEVTQAEYDALTPPDPKTLYVVVG